MPYLISLYFLAFYVTLRTKEDNNKFIMNRRLAFFPIHHSLLIVLIFIAAIILSYFYFDKPFAVFFHKVPHFLFSIGYFINEFTNPVPNVLLWPLIFYFVYFILKKEPLGEKILLVAISINAANAVSIPIKMIFGRYRPALLFSQHLYGFDFFAIHNSELSFPSGHAVTISAIMFALSCLYPKRSMFFLLIGFILSFARVIVDDHYLSDIFASMLIGLMISQFVFISMKRSSSSTFK